MWKTQVSLRAATLFYQQANVDKKAVFNSPCEKDFNKNLSTAFFSTFHSPCG